MFRKKQEGKEEERRGKGNAMRTPLDQFHWDTFASPVCIRLHMSTMLLSQDDTLIF